MTLRHEVADAARSSAKVESALENRTTRLFGHS